MVSSARLAARTSTSEFLGSASKSWRKALSISRCCIYIVAPNLIHSIDGMDLEYASTIAQGCCDHAAPDRRSIGRGLGRSEMVPGLCEIQKLPPCRGAA